LLHPVTYEYQKGFDGKPILNSTASTNNRSTGFLAQEVEKAAGAINYKFSGVDKPTNAETMYGLRYAEFVPVLVKALQEQQAMIVELKKKVEDLENKK
jgi:hypothetical protein